MIALNQIEHIAPPPQKTLQDPYESVMMECGRLIHAAVISRHFQSMLLADPVKSIEAGFCGEKFSFTRQEKEQIRQIRATTLAEFSNQLMQVLRTCNCLAPAPAISFASVHAH